MRPKLKNLLPNATTTKEKEANGATHAKHNEALEANETNAAHVRHENQRLVIADCLLILAKTMASIRAK